jgi:D-alanyl-D-alanine carboxypeptidase
MLRTPPTLWTPAGVITGPDAQNQLLDEAHVVAAVWSGYGTAPCDPAAPFAGVFPVPATALADRCNPVENVRAAARLVLDQESRPLDQRPGTTEWERAAAGWATMPPAFGDGTANRFATEGPPALGFSPSDACVTGLAAALDAEAAAEPAFAGLAPMAGFAPAAVDFDSARWDAAFATTPLDPLVGAGGACDPASDRAAGFGWLAGQLASRLPAGGAAPDPGLAGAAAYATWVADRGEVPAVGRTGLVPRLHNPRIVAPAITRPPVTGEAAPANPGDFADRVIAKAEVYAGYATAVAVEAVGWEPLVALGIPEHAARAYAKATELIAGIEPGCAIDVAYLAGFGFMESGHGTVAVDPVTGESDHPPPRAPVRWDPATGESQPRILGALLDGSGAGGNVTPVPNRLSPSDRAFYGQDEPFLRAVGPTQFMPGTWETVRAVVDGNGDGVADPFNYYDGALATAVKACRDGGGLATEADQRRAALAYNRSPSYAAGVLAKAAEYRAGLAAQGLGAAGDGGAGRSVVLGAGPVSIVRVDGIGVNAAVAESVRAMLAAARADGLELADGAGGWRSQASQVALRRAHCGTSDYAIYQMPASRCSPPTAIPGTSQHERGLAIDFTCNGRPIGQHDHGNPCYLWLSAHAGSYGMHNLPSEAWHWSTTGK